MDRIEQSLRVALSVLRATSPGEQGEQPLATPLSLRSVPHSLGPGDTLPTSRQSSCNPANPGNPVFLQLPFATAFLAMAAACAEPPPVSISASLTGPQHAVHVTGIVPHHHDQALAARARRLPVVASRRRVRRWRQSCHRHHVGIPASRAHPTRTRPVHGERHHAPFHAAVPIRSRREVPGRRRYVSVRRHGRTRERDATDHASLCDSRHGASTNDADHCRSSSASGITEQSPSVVSRVLGAHGGGQRARARAPHR